MSESKIEKVVVPERQITMIQYDGVNMNDVTAFLHAHAENEWLAVHGRVTRIGDWLYRHTDGEVCVMSPRAKEAFTRPVISEATNEATNEATDEATGDSTM